MNILASGSTCRVSGTATSSSSANGAGPYNVTWTTTFDNAFVSYTNTGGGGYYGMSYGKWYTYYGTFYTTTGYGMLWSKENRIDTSYLTKETIDTLTSSQWR